MTGYEAYCLYTSLKLHFTQESYNYFKYGGKTNVSIESFENRKDKYHYYKISRRYEKDEYVNFLVANFLIDSNVWIGKLLEDEAHQNYLSRQKIQQSLMYSFENDCRNLFEEVKNPNDLLTNTDNYPILLSKVFRKETNIETLIILSDILGFLPMWCKKINDTIQWPNFYHKLTKYKLFLNYDKTKYQQKLKSILVI